MTAIQIHVDSLMQTNALAQRVAPMLGVGDAVLLHGDLGAGKSAFSRALIQTLAGTKIEVPSPTYTLVQVYELPDFTLYHFDLYRISDPDELYELDWEVAQSNGVCLVEWPSRLGHLTPNDALNIKISITGDDSRQFDVDSDHPHWRQRLPGLEP